MCEGDNIWFSPYPLWHTVQEVRSPDGNRDFCSWWHQKEHTTVRQSIAMMDGDSAATFRDGDLCGHLIFGLKIQDLLNMHKFDMFNKEFSNEGQVSDGRRREIDSVKARFGSADTFVESFA